MTNDQIVAGYNMVWIVAGLLVGVYFAAAATVRARHTVDYVTCLMAGVALVSLGSVFHRFFWNIWRWLRAAGLNDTAAIFPDAAAGFGGVAVALICLGYSFHLRFPARRMFGRYWPAAIAALFALGFLVGAFADRIILLVMRAI